MNNTPLINLDNISKKFCRSREHSMRYGLLDITKKALSNAPLPSDLREDEFWALKDISFSVQRGECLGIMGLNASGKSTLLKIISQVYQQTKGTVTTQGKIISVLDLGGCLSYEFTGRENIDLLAALYNKTKSEVQKLYDKVIEFSGLHDFIDAPLRTYSKGMKLRLAFSVTIFLEPDILLLDEVLTVGDICFRRKCQDFLLKIRPKSAIILVSQIIAQITKICTKALILDQGRLMHMGDVSETTYFYFSKLDDISSQNLTYGADQVIFKNAYLISKAYPEKNKCDYGDAVEIRFTIKPKCTIHEYTLAFNVFNQEYESIFSSRDYCGFKELGENSIRHISVSMDKIELIPGKYYVNIFLYNHLNIETMNASVNAITFYVVQGTHGKFPLNYKLQWNEAHKEV